MTSTAVTVAVDANGADLGPAEVARGATLAASGGDVRIILFGPAEAMADEVGPGVEVVDAPRSIAKDPSPVQAVRTHPDASIVQAVRSVAEGRADALVAGGSTGAALAAGLAHIRRARGVHRPALALWTPVPHSPFLLLDVGANLSVRPEHLVQFAHMGAAFVAAVMGVERPTVGLLSNGTEPTRGPDDVRSAHAALLESPPGQGRFVGNVEGFTIVDGAADVVVTDGFTGNVVLKTMEGASATMLRVVRDATESGMRARAGGLLLRPTLHVLRDQLDPEAVGGAVLLGLRRLVVVPHGSFGAAGIAAAVRVAERGIRGNLIDRTHETLEAAGALRGSPAAPSARAPATSVPAPSATSVSVPDA